jgi:hypothetical protein
MLFTQDSFHHTVSPALALLNIPINRAQGLQSPHILTNTCHCLGFLIAAFLVGVRWYFIGILICISWRWDIQNDLDIKAAGPA